MMPLTVPLRNRQFAGVVFRQNIALCLSPSHKALEGIFHQRQTATAKVSRIRVIRTDFHGAVIQETSTATFRLEDAVYSTAKIERITWRAGVGSSMADRTRAVT